MKKILLGTSALVALGSVAFAGSAPTMTVSGVMEVEMSVIGMKNNGPLVDGKVNNNSGGQLATGHDITMPSSTNEIHFKGEGKTDSGLVYGARYEFRPGTGPAGATDMEVDEAVIYFSGDWGRLDLGQEDSAGDLMTINGSQNTGASGAWNGDGWLTAFDDSDRLATIASSLRRITNGQDASKVTYRSPVVNGLQLGASFIPSAKMSLAAANSTDKNAASYENTWNLAAKYNQQVGDAKIGLYAEYMAGKTAKPQTDPTKNDGRKTAFGGSIGVGPVAVSASYVNHGKSGVKINPATGEDRNAGTFNDVGVSYTMPDGSVVGTGIAKAQIAVQGQDKKRTATWYTVGGTTPIAPGASAYFEYNNNTSDDGKGAITSKITGQEALVGTKVTF